MRVDAGVIAHSVEETWRCALFPVGSYHFLAMNLSYSSIKANLEAWLAGQQRQLVNFVSLKLELAPL